MPYKDPKKQKAYDRARYLAQVAAGNKRQAMYAAGHREECRERARKWHAANRKKSRDAAKAYRKSHPRQADAWSAAWKKRNRSRVIARVAAWSAADRLACPEKYTERAARRKAQKLQTQVEKIDFMQILRDSKGICGICGKPLDLFGIDFYHIVPLSKGGAHARNNIQPSHSYCNRAKGARVG